MEESVKSEDEIQQHRKRSTLVSPSLRLSMQSDDSIIRESKALVLETTRKQSESTPRKSISDSNVVLREGFLLKKINNRSWKHRYALLKSTCIMDYEVDANRQPVLSQPPAITQLAGTSILVNRGKFKFIIQSDSSKEQSPFRAESEDAMEEWVEAVCSAQTKLGGKGDLSTVTPTFYKGAKKERLQKLTGLFGMKGKQANEDDENTHSNHVSIAALERYAEALGDCIAKIKSTYTKKDFNLQETLTLVDCCDDTVAQAQLVIKQFDIPDSAEIQSCFEVIYQDLGIILQNMDEIFAMTGEYVSPNSQRVSTIDVACRRLSETVEHLSGLVLDSEVLDSLSSGYMNIPTLARRKSLRTVSMDDNKIRSPDSSEAGSRSESVTVTVDESADAIEHDNNVRRLVDMGFSESDASAALKNCNHDMNEALSVLLQSNGPQPSANEGGFHSPLALRKRARSLFHSEKKSSSNTLTQPAAFVRSLSSEDISHLRDTKLISDGGGFAVVERSSTTDNVATPFRESVNSFSNLSTSSHDSCEALDKSVTRGRSKSLSTGSTKDEGSPDGKAEQPKDNHRLSRQFSGRGFQDAVFGGTRGRVHTVSVTRRRPDPDVALFPQSWSMPNASLDVSTLLFGSEAPTQDRVKKLKEMGFSASEAEASLQTNKMNLQAALDDLLALHSSDNAGVNGEHLRASAIALMADDDDDDLGPSSPEKPVKSSPLSKEQPPKPPPRKVTIGGVTMGSTGTDDRDVEVDTSADESEARSPSPKLSPIKPKLPPKPAALQSPKLPPKPKPKVNQVPLPPKPAVLKFPPPPKVVKPRAESPPTPIPPPRRKRQNTSEEPTQQSAAAATATSTKKTAEQKEATNPFRKAVSASELPDSLSLSGMMLDNDDDSIVFATKVMEGRIIKRVRAATLPAVLSHLVSEQNNDPDLLNCVTLCYATFTTSEALLDLLINQHLQFVKIEKDEGNEVDPAVVRAHKRVGWVLANLIKPIWKDLTDSQFQKINRLSRDLINHGHLDIVRQLRSKMLTQRRQVALAKKLELENQKAEKDERRAPLSSMAISTKVTTIHDFHTMDIAKEFALMDCELFQAIEPEELIRWAKRQSKETSPNIFKMITHFNNVSMWCATLITTTMTLKERAKIVQKLVSVMNGLRKLQNFNSLLAILSGFNSSAVHRLNHTFETAGARTRASLEKLNALMSHEKSFSTYRAALGTRSLPVVPYLGLYLTDITFVHQGNDDNVASPTNPDLTLINFAKRQRMYAICASFQHFQSAGYNFLSKSEVIDFFGDFPHKDEETLFALSMHVEPRGHTIDQIE